MNWKVIDLKTDEQVFDVLLQLKGKRWLSRGQPEPWGNLVPSIDRVFQTFSRAEKLNLERRSIDLFKSTARFFAGEAEAGALNNDLVALMVLRHYGAPTRLLDWSLSPYIAAYFAVSEDGANGELWAFNEPQYEINGKNQWRQFPQTTWNGDPDKFDPHLTAFLVEEPCSWFVALFYKYKDYSFPRADAQQGMFTMTSRLNYCHAEAIKDLIFPNDESCYHRYVIPAKLKEAVRRRLREEHGIWRGSLYPDSAGAAETVKQDIFLLASYSRPVRRSEQSKPDDKASMSDQ